MLLEDSNPMGYYVHLVACARLGEYIAGKMHPRIASFSNAVVAKL